MSTSEAPNGGRRVDPLRGPVPWLTEVGVGAFLATAVLLLVLRPDYDPLRRYLSEYAVGPGGWAMRVGFVLLGLASLNLAAGFRGDPGPADGRAIGWALAVWGAADLAAAFFPVDLQGEAPTTAGVLHLVAAGVGFVALFVAMALAVSRFRRSDRWSDLASLTRGFAIATPAAFVLEASLFSTLGWMGLGQWPLYGLAAGWLLLLARRFRRLRRLSGR